MGNIFSRPKPWPLIESFKEEFLVSPHKCYATGKGLGVAELGESVSVILHIVDNECRPYIHPVKNRTCELVSESTDEKIVCAVKKPKAIGEYEISYKPISRGRHQLHIKVEGENIKESPFSVVVKYPLKWPNGVAVNSKGHIIVVEQGAHRVSIFNPAGEKVIPSFGSFGSQIGQFNEPRGVAVDDEDNILVVDSWNHRIQKFASDGAFITATVTSKEFYFQHPAGIAIHPSSKRVYVADNNNHCIKILNPDLTLSSSFGHEGSGNGQFKNPYDVAFDSAGNVYVADQNNHRIQIFTANGDYLMQFGRYGSGNGELNGPNGIYIDTKDVVYVTEWHNNRVSLYGYQDVDDFLVPQFLNSFGYLGSKRGQFKSPYGITIDKDENIYVADLANNRVQVF